jgi:hypothetical protein
MVAVLRRNIMNGKRGQGVRDQNSKAAEGVNRDGFALSPSVP